MNESPTLPSMKEIIDGATPEQLRQLQQMILAEAQERLSKNEGSNRK